MAKQTFSRCSKVYILTSQLEYWFKNRKKGFFKFMEPCPHKAYKPGDSWTEELGICRKTVIEAFNQIGIRYKSKTDYLAATDKFKGKMYLSYYNRDTKQTHYLKNHEIEDQFVNKFPTQKTSKIKIIENPVPSERKNNPKNSENTNLQNGKKSCSSGGTIGGKVNFPTSLTRTTTLFKPVSINETAMNDDEKIAIAMKKIWVEEVEDFGEVRVPPTFTRTLVLAFKKVFNNCMETWRKYCQMIASSKFLMGEGSNISFKKIWITWAIKPETYERIKRGDFGLGTRAPKETKESKKQTKLIEEKRDLELERHTIENTIEIIQQEVEKERRRALNEHIEDLDEEETEVLKDKFVEMLKERDDPLLKDCGNKLWDSHWTQMSFERYIRTELAKTIFSKSLEDALQERLNKTNLPRLLLKVNQELESLEKERKKKVKDSTSIPLNNDLQLIAC